MNKIIVTGGCGYIGSHTVITLLEHDFDVVILDDLSNSNNSIIDRIERITGIRPTFIKVDLKDFNTTKKNFQEHRDAIAVIHFAAYKAVAESVEKPLLYYENNLIGAINTLKLMEEYKIDRFIFSSSATVYGEPDCLPITEKFETKRPYSPYGNTKKVTEEIIEDVVKSNVNFSAISLRYFNPIGAHGSGIIGELPNGTPNNLMPYITQTAIGKRKKLFIYGNNYSTVDGTAIRDYIHVEDLANAHVKAIQRLIFEEQDAPYEVFNLGSGKGHSVLEVVKTFIETSGIPVKYEVVERRPGDVPELYASSDLAREKLKWVAKRNLKNMIVSSWKWEQNFYLEKE